MLSECVVRDAFFLLIWMFFSSLIRIFGRPKWMSNNKFSKLNRTRTLFALPKSKQCKKRIMLNKCCSGDFSTTHTHRIYDAHKHHPSSSEWRISWCYECFNYAHVLTLNWMLKTSIIALHMCRCSIVLSFVHSLAYSFAPPRFVIYSKSLKLNDRVDVFAFSFTMWCIAHKSLLE